MKTKRGGREMVLNFSLLLGRDHKVQEACLVHLEDLVLR